MAIIKTTHLNHTKSTLSKIISAPKTTKINNAIKKCQFF